MLVNKTRKTNTKIVFDENGEVSSTIDNPSIVSVQGDDIVEEEDYFAKREKKRLQLQQKNTDHDDELHKKWYHVYAQFPSNSNEITDLKENEQMELYNLCRTSFSSELQAFNKRNSADARWLQTALHKGTAKDRSNAGALLVTNNPIGNLEALSTLIGFTKPSNKASTEVVSTVTDLWKEVLLPPHRKLIALNMRGTDWKLVRKDTTLSKEKQRRIYAYWHFENELKDLYFEYLKNIQQSIQTGQEVNKNASIISAAQLLAYAPEKEQMLLTMLVNKLGDPVAKVASKALHHLTEVTQKHPNMSLVVVKEAEKLLFRNNISDRAQHFALCFMASTASCGNAEVSSKLVHICFAFFKTLVQKGAINSRTMQAILRCLQKALVEGKSVESQDGILNKEMQDTVYRLVHLADIRISIQTLGLLMQLVAAKSENGERFYNALYKKMLDMELITVGVKTAAQLLHIIHRAVHLDGNVPRAQAFLKRLLQMSLYMPSHIAAGCLMVVHKLIRSRKELANSATAPPITTEIILSDEQLKKFEDDDEEEKYVDVQDDNDDEIQEKDENCDVTPDVEIVGKEIVEKNPKDNNAIQSSSWHHVNVELTDSKKLKTKELSVTKYDPFHRVPAFAGAELAMRTELLLLQRHFHPTVQVFADNIINNKRIDYYGDPLRDFGLPHFLERFAFKNPKKLNNEKANTPSMAHKPYVSFGARGKPVHSLTKANCTEDEMFIFNYLEQKRQRAAQNKMKKSTEVGDDQDPDLQPKEVTDGEFESYLDNFFGKKDKSKFKGASEDQEDEELDYLSELGGELQKESNAKKKKGKSANDDDEDDDINADWSDDNEAMSENDDGDSDEGSVDESYSKGVGGKDGEFDDDDDEDDEGSISLDEEMASAGSDSDDSNGEAFNMDESDEDANSELAAPSAKKRAKSAGKLSEKSFAKQLKHSSDMSKLFAAADDFGEMLEETAKTKGHGTRNALFNKDKSTDKQMKWEEKRRSNARTYMGKRDRPLAKKRKIK